ncbi:MAG: response regulator [Candidatus Omnitrophota bacterium]
MAGENILVVDDEDIIGLVFKRELEAKGFNVDHVPGGEEAVKAVALKKYDLVFIDKMMPGLDGLETCKRLRKLTPESILIFMTGLLDRENMFNEWKFTEAGGKTYYLYKPFVDGELVEVVGKALKERK